MKKVLIVLAVVFIAMIAVIAFAVSVRNGLIAGDESVKAAWSEIDTQLQRRFDLIPNLVESVKGYAKHEEKVFSEIAGARAAMMNAKSPAEKAGVESEMRSALGRLFAVVENYPNLKADKSFIRLQDELAGTENRIGVARTRYNRAAKEFNASIRQFPGSLFAGGLGLGSAEYFQPPAGARVNTVPKVAF